MYDLRLTRCTIVTPALEIEDGAVSIKDGKIAFIGKRNSVHLEKSQEEIDVKGHLVVPGFFDIHTHGGAGVGYNEITDIQKGTEILEKISCLSAAEGTTSFLPTMSIGPDETLDEFISKVGIASDIMGNIYKAARPLGLNLELFMYPGLGAFAPAGEQQQPVPRPNIPTWKKIQAAAKKAVKIVTVAPEWDDGLDLIQHLRFNGIVPSIGHTFAEDSILDEAIRRGALLVTHLLNTTFQPKQDQIGVIVPGVNEYLLTRDDIMAEIIVDNNGSHVHPTMLKIAIKCLGTDRLITITDAVKSRGTDATEFEREGTTLFCDGNVNRKPDGHLSGTALGMNRVIRNFIAQGKVTLQEALKTATINPARLLNISHKKGSIETGKDADITVIDSDFNIFLTLVGGKVVYQDLD
ncbi:MAG: N-acetylglucosamine-6-phosphate deacetylase [Spirochaetota bacterium]